jgi:putative phosphoesterase
MNGKLRALIISDTHGRTERIDQVRKQAGAFDLMIHAGDHAEDVLDGGYDDAVTVCGNCDTDGIEEEEKTFGLLGVKTLLLHGHTVNVKTSPLQLVYKAAEHEAQLAVFGHTHTPTLFVEDGRVFLNPGSLSVPRGYTECTYAILELTREESGVNAEFSFYTLDGYRIPAFDMTHRFSVR